MLGGNAPLSDVERLKWKTETLDGEGTSRPYCTEQPLFGQVLVTLHVRPNIILNVGYSPMCLNS